MSENKKRVISVLLASTIGISTVGLLKEGIEFIFVDNKYSDIVLNVTDKDKTEEFVKDFKKSVNDNKYLLKKDRDKVLGVEFIEDFKPFIEEYGKYFTNKEVNFFLNGISTKEIKVDSFDNNCIGLFNLMVDMLDSDSKYTNLNKAYVASIINTYLGHDALENSYMCYEFQKFTDVLSKEVVSKYMFNQDIEGLIEELKKYYCLEDNIKINMFIELINKGCKENLDVNTKINISNEFDELYKEVIKNKLEKDSNFKNTLRGKISNEYINGKDSDIELYYQSDRGIKYRFSSDKYGSITLFNTKFNPNDKKELDEIMKIYANNILYEKLNGNEFSRKTLELLSYIVDWSVFKDFNENNSLDILFSSLSNYFNNKNDLAAFIISLDNGNKVAVKEYLEIFTDIMINRDATLENIAEVKQLEKFSNDYIYYHVNGYDMDMNPRYDYENVIKGSKEAEEFFVTVEDFIFSEVDAEPYFKKIRDKYSDDGLLFNDTANNSLYKERNILTQSISYKTYEDICVYSDCVKPEQIYLNGKYYVYYKIPEFYKDSECIRVRTNIENEKFEEVVKGFVTNMYNYNLGINEEVYLVHMGDKQNLNNFEPVVFKTIYDNLMIYNNNFNNEKVLNLKK